MSSPEFVNHAPTAATPIGKLLAECLLRNLERYAPLPLALRASLQRSVLRLLDSAMLIEDPLTPFKPSPPPPHTFPLPELPTLGLIEEALAEIAKDGLINNFVRMTGSFTTILRDTRCNDEQRAMIEEWHGSGMAGALFITDRGGPSMKQWLSEYNPETRRLRIDKLWGIGGIEFGFAGFAATQPGAIAPVLMLVPPEACAELKRTPIGLPYLNGTVQLGNVAGEVEIDPKYLLTKGGLMGVKQYLTVVRPRFVRGICSHVAWLERQGRARRTPEQREAFAYVQQIAEDLCKVNVFTRYSEDEVMAVKFASNEIVLQLIESGGVPDLMDQRDLLGFTKMEGSSYRCFYEIYMRNKGARNVG